MPMQIGDDMPMPIDTELFGEFDNVTGNPEWNTGDIVTAEKLNNIEGAINNVHGGGNLVATVTFDEAEDYYILNKSWQDIKAVFDAGGVVMARYVTNEEPITGIHIWYLTSIMSAESPTGDAIYGAIFTDSDTPENMYATDPTEPLTSQDPLHISNQ